MKLTYEQRHLLQRFINDLDESRSTLESAINHYNGIVADAYNFITSVANQFREEFEELNEDLQESEVGQEILEFVQEWEEIDFSRDIEADLLHADMLGELRTECE
jgi:hypothetical protein